MSAHLVADENAGAQAHPDTAEGLAMTASRAAAGDAEALGRLVPALYPAVRTFLHARLASLADDDALADVTQDAVIRAVAGLPAVRAATDREFLAWVRAVAWRVALDALRAPFSHVSRRAAVSWDEAVHGASEAPGAVPGDEDEVAPMAQLARLAAEAQIALSTDSALALWLRLVAGAPWEEVGEALATTTAAAKRRVQRAQATLRRRVWDGAAALPAPDRDAVLACLRAIDPEGAAARAGLRAPRARRARAARAQAAPNPERPDCVAS